jgi:Ca-activated chloride channel family protein
MPEEDQMRFTKRTYRTLAASAAIALLTMAVVACSGNDDDDDGAYAPAAATQAPAEAYEAEAATEAAAASDSSSGAQRVRSDDAEAAPEAIYQPYPQRPGPADTTFRDYGRTPYVDASTDAVSTFSLDTDRTSYFLALSWAQNGYAVEPDSVRAEEWINAFNYDYDRPGRADSFAITTDVVGHPLGGGRHLARVAFQAPDVRDDVPLNVTLVLDASGSMSDGNRVAIAREAAEAIRESLDSRDRIAVVHFTTDVIDGYTVRHSRPDDRDVAWSIGQLAPHNSTNVQAGLDLGVRLADDARRDRPDAYNYIILMSDGVANVDATNPFAILDSSPDRDHRNPLRLITIGVGINNYNDFLLEQLAQHGNGWYRYLDDTGQARETFSRENWLALSTPFADQARAQVTWDPALVSSWRIVGYENRITADHTFEQNRKEFAELPSGAATTVFYELVLHREAGGRSAVLGDVEVRWVDPSSGDTYSQRSRVAGDTNAPFDAGDRHLRFGAIVALASDRYSALSPQHENAAVDVDGIASDLAALRSELGSLYERLGSLQAYSDFSFLLDQLAARAEELAPGSSGYSQ